MYAHIIILEDELWDILEDEINIQVNSVGMVSDWKSLIPSQKNICIKNCRVRGVLVDAQPHYEYIKIINKYTSRSIFKSLFFTYEGN